MKNASKWIVAAAALALATVSFANDYFDGDPRVDQIQPGQVIYDFNNHENTCYPDDWTFFGYPQTDFGFTEQVEDGAGAFQTAGWTYCDVNEFPQCIWTGSVIGAGIFAHPQCTPGGVDDANLDLSLGTGLTVRVINDLTAGYGGTLGARVQLILEDPDGTVAVVPRAILQNTAVNRTPPVADSFQTYTFFFQGLDWAWDNDSAVAGAIPGLDLTHITTVRFMWRRYTADGTNSFRFDEIALTDAPALPWADVNGDADVDMADLATFQAQFGQAPAGSYARLDADYSGLIEVNDWSVWKDCIEGPDVTTGFYAWAY